MPGDDGVPIDTEGTTGTPTNPSTSLVPTDTMPTVDPDSGTMSPTEGSSDDGGAICEPACAAGECCVGAAGDPGVCFDEPDAGCEPACAPTQSCEFLAGEDPCNPDALTECVGCGVDEESYAGCLIDPCPEGEFCLSDGMSFGVCAALGCGEDACACPLAPGDGKDPALNNCGDFGDPVNDACYLDCAEGNCPQGMTCIELTIGLSICAEVDPATLGDCCVDNGTPGCEDMACNDLVCGMDGFCCGADGGAWDDVCAGIAEENCVDPDMPMEPLCVPEPPEPLYGDCINGGPCEMDNVCLSNGTVGWCSLTPCMDNTDCEPAPMTGDAPAECTEFLDGMMMPFNACALNCAMGETCPDGMVCAAVLGNVCVWEPPPPPEQPGYGDCVDNPVTTCIMGEDACVMGDGMMPSAGACSVSGCMDAMMDCPAAPPTGTAVVTCGDLGAGNTCYLDCSMGEMCPDGTVCTATNMGANMACLWEDQGNLLSEDFELGTFRPDWLLMDVDMNVPNGAVAFVDNAWVVSDEIEPAMNFAAYSTSWYAPGEQADDWMITPQITPSATSMLTWDGLTPNAMFPDGYNVWVSTAGTNVPADFTDMVFSIAAEAQVYTPHMVDLSAYAGMPIYIAWQNNSTDQLILLIDNIVVTE